MKARLSLAILLSLLLVACSNTFTTQTKEKVVLTCHVTEKVEKECEIGSGKAGQPAVKGEGYRGIVTIPSSANGYYIDAIGESAFSGFAGMTSVVIPPSITAIGDRAFMECDGLTSVVLPSRVKTFGEGVFASCKQLRMVRFRCPLERVSDHMFDGCELLQALELPKGVKSVGDYAFKDCRSLRELTLPSGVTSIGMEAFMGCQALEAMVIPEGVTTIGDGAFENCYNLVSIHIPASVKSIGTAAFRNCPRLVSITVDPENKVFDSRNGCNAIIVTAYDRLIMGCKGTVIPPSVKCIGEKAFNSCQTLKEITIPESVDTIGTMAFYNCRNLSYVSLPKSLRIIDPFAFAYTSLQTVTIPSGVTQIWLKAFAEIPTLTSITSQIENPFDLEYPICDETGYDTVTLYVPAGTKEKYMAAEGWKNFTHIVEMESIVIGDANGDGNLSVADMTAIAHYVLGHTLEGFSETAADVNQDGQVNVADYTAVAHLLLYGSIERPASTRVDMGPAPTQATDMSQLDNTMYMAPASAIAGEELTLSVRMKNAVDAEGFQFTLTLPEDMSVVRDDEGFAEASLSTERTTKEGTNTFATSLLPDGTLKVMAASTNGSVIKAGDGEVCTIRIKVNADMAEGDYALLLSDVAISDTNAKSYDVEPLEATLTVHEVSGISAALNDKGEMINEKCFDLQGRKIENSKSVNSKFRKGVYIHDGKKYVK